MTLRVRCIYDVASKHFHCATNKFVVKQINLHGESEKHLRGKKKVVVLHRVVINVRSFAHKLWTCIDSKHSISVILRRWNWSALATDPEEFRLISLSLLPFSLFWWCRGWNKSNEMRNEFIGSGGVMGEGGLEDIQWDGREFERIFRGEGFERELEIKIVLIENWKKLLQTSRIKRKIAKLKSLHPSENIL